MLTVLSEADFDRYIDRMYELALIPECTGYPVWYDGYKTKDMFIERTRKAFARENEEILLFTLDGEFCGWVQYYELPEDRYFGTVSMGASRGMERMLSEFLDFAEARFPDDSVYLGFPAENREALDFLPSRGFRLGESTWNMLLRDLPRVEPDLPAETVMRIGRENFDLFRALHAKNGETMYWNADRIEKTLDDWILFVLVRDGVPKAAACCSRDDYAEIFSLDFAGDFDPSAASSLLRACAAAAKEDGSAVLGYFCEDEEKQAVEDAGFSCVGQYVMMERVPAQAE